MRAYVVYVVYVVYAFQKMKTPSGSQRRALSEHEQTLLQRWSDQESDQALVLQAREIFRATIVEILPTAHADQELDGQDQAQQLDLQLNNDFVPSPATRAKGGEHNSRVLSPGKSSVLAGTAHNHTKPKSGEQPYGKQ